MPKIGEFTSIRKAAPEALRRRGRRAYVVVGSRTARHRPLPDFVVVGAQRWGRPRCSALSSPIRRSLVRRSRASTTSTSTTDAGWTGPRPFPVDRRHRPGERGSLAYFEASGYYAYHPFAMERMAATYLASGS